MSGVLVGPMTTHLEGYPEEWLSKRDSDQITPDDHLSGVATAPDVIHKALPVLFGDGFGYEMGKYQSTEWARQVPALATRSAAYRRDSQARSAECCGRVRIRSKRIAS